MKNNEIKQYKTSDLSLTAVIQLYGFEIKEIDRSNPRRIIFVMDKNKELDDLIQAFWSRNLKVEPLAYFESIKLIKARIYQQ